MKDFNDFMRACYLNSEPSVDLNAAKETVDCRKHKLRMGVYEKLMDKLTEALRGEHEPSEVRMACNMWMLQSGPQLVNDCRTN